MKDEKMNDADEVLKQFDQAIQSWSDHCSQDPTKWHSADTVRFREIKAQLLPFAESGEVRCQYALASTHWLGLCQETEAAFESVYAEEIVEATKWLVAAAKQGHIGALDNLITSGVRPEAELAREVSKMIEKERPELVGWSQNMPVYTPSFFLEVSKRFLSNPGL